MQLNGEWGFSTQDRIGHECIRHRHQGPQCIGIQLQKKVRLVDHQELQLVVLERRIVNAASAVHRGVVVQQIGKADTWSKIEILLVKRARVVGVRGG